MQNTLARDPMRDPRKIVFRYEAISAAVFLLAAVLFFVLDPDLAGMPLWLPVAALVTAFVALMGLKWLGFGFYSTFLAARQKRGIEKRLAYGRVLASEIDEKLNRLEERERR